MVPPIAGNGRAKSGRLPLPPAAIPVAVPAPPVAGSLPHPIKWDPHPSFYRFSPFPSLPVVVSPLPAFSFSLSDAGRPPATSPSSPEHRPAVPSPPSALQHRPLHRPHRLLAGNSPERCPRRQPVALVPLYSLQPAAVHRRCADRRRRLLLRHRGIAFFPGITSSSPEFRRNAVVSAPASPSSSSARRPAAPPPSPTSQRRVPRRPLLRSAAAACHHRFIVVSDRSRRRRPVGCPARRLAAPPPSSASQRRVPRRPRLRAATAGCPRRLLAGSGRRRRRPLVVPGSDRRGVRPSVKPFSFVVLASSSAAAPSSSSSSPPRRQASCRPRLAFVLGSPPKSSPRRSSPWFPAASAAPVRRCRSHASSRGGKDPSPAAPSSSFRCRPCSLCGCRPRYPCTGVGS